MHSDVVLAQKYIHKAENAKSAGHSFSISFMSYKNMMTAKRCYYSGVLLTNKASGKPLRATDVTIDRIDNSIGYEPGNVVACSHMANIFKSSIENPYHPMDISLAQNMVKNISKKIAGDA